MPFWLCLYNTVRRHCGIPKQLFQAAARIELVRSNPFDEMNRHVQGNADRLYSVTRREAEMVLDHCIDAEWRLMFALGRYGGLRCPSGVLSLEWGHVDFAANRITVPSPKTERHEGDASRLIPLYAARGGEERGT